MVSQRRGPRLIGRKPWIDPVRALVVEQEKELEAESRDLIQSNQRPAMLPGEHSVIHEDSLHVPATGMSVRRIASATARWSLPKGAAVLAPLDDLSLLFVQQPTEG
jgi:hypothetical protein